MPSTSVDPRKLRTLFEAYGKDDDEQFVRAAESIIQGELSANHFGEASALREALKKTGSMKVLSPQRELGSFPKDRRSGEDLLWLVEPKCGLDSIVLQPATEAHLRRVIREQSARSKIRSFGLRPRNKLLFWGPPGNGKTITAHALGYELGLPVATVRLDSLISSYLGDTASHINRIFARAASTPMVLFFDEVDAVGKRRDDPQDVGELKRIVNTLLQQIDRAENTDSVFVAASNHQHLLDAALWRRFDAVIEFPQPEGQQRARLLHNVLRDVQVTGTIQKVISASIGMSCADIERAAHDALKSMIIEGRQSLKVDDLLSEIRVSQLDNKKARQGKQKNHERRIPTSFIDRSSKTKAKTGARKTRTAR
jgi:SpoVK/Ycf46/Vps4 family AAA+-type ATPase